MPYMLPNLNQCSFKASYYYELYFSMPIEIMTIKIKVLLITLIKMSGSYSFGRLASKMVI